MSDVIETYITTIRDNVQMYCLMCMTLRMVWVGRTRDGNVITCCSYCQYVLVRVKADG